MFEGYSPATIDFLWGIRFNNNREWFQAHKADYEQHLYRPTLALAEAVRQGISIPGTIVKSARIYRDVRYSKGIPYKEHLWFCLREDNVFWSEHPSMYFQIEPEGGSIGFIFYAPKSALMEAHRRRMLEKPDEFSSIMAEILDSGRFQDRSTRYKRAKEGGTPDMDPWYQLKNCFLEEFIPVGDALFDPALPQRILSAWNILLPLYQYFRDLEKA